MQTRMGLGLGLGMTRGGGGGFDPADLFDVNGFWGDAGDAATLFQDNVGTTLVTATGQQVGFQLDKSQGLVLGPELVPDPGFDTPAAWTPQDANWTVSGGKATYADVGLSYLQSAASISITSGQWYVCRFTISGATPAVNAALLSVFNTAATINYWGAYQTFTNNGEYTVYFQATSSSTGIRIYGNGSSLAGWSLESFSIKAILGNHATQSGSSFRPFFREASGVGYLDYDALDDRLLGTALCGSGDNSIAVKTTVPASIASTQVIAGLSGSSTARFFLAVNTSGFLCAGVGNNSTTTIVGSTDIRGQTGVAMLVEEGSTVTLYWNGVVQYTGALSGAPSTTQPFYYGALNNNGAAGSFYGGDIYWAISLRRAFTAAERAGLNAL